jgi:hypothetical protein
MWPSSGGAVCAADPVCVGGNWNTGTKITLSEPVFKINGKPNVAFSGMRAYRASKFSCTSCKCAGGCSVTVSVTNDGKKFSGSGVGGSVWSGAALSFSLKDIVPTVQYIDHDRSTGMMGYRDSTRIFGPASGGTTIEVYGENFQDSDLLRCYFAGVTTLVKAEWLSSNKLRCKTPDFFSRQLDLSTTTANQDGSAKTPHSKVHVTNDGMLGDAEGEGDAFGHISQNPYLQDDGSKAYIWTFDQANTYESGMTGFHTNPFRSTCQEGVYPNEGMKPCWGAHGTSIVMPAGTTAPSYSAGNDVLFKYATCYDANPAQSSPSLDLYSGTDQNARAVNRTSTLGQKISLTGREGLVNHDDTDGPVAYLELHLYKASQGEAEIEVSISSGDMHTPTVISKETIVVSKIDPTSVDYKYHVFFNTPAYLLNGKTYNVQLRYVRGDEDVHWKYTDHPDHGGYYAHINTPIYGRFKLRGFTCDACRTKYSFEPATPDLSLMFGDWVSSLEGGGSTYLTPNTYRSMLAQEFRPSETGTITHAYLKLQNVPDNGVQQSYVSIWITQYGKYGEYVCSAYGGTMSGNVCDTNMDGNFNEACALGKVCDPALALNGGCGDRGACTLAETVTNAHRLRPESGGAAGPCGASEKCSVTMTLAPDHRKIVKDLTTSAWVEFEFKTPVPVDKHTTYFLNAAVVGNIDISKKVIWENGRHHGDGGALNRTEGPLQGHDANPISDELRAAFLRDKTDWRWKKQVNMSLATKLTRCVSSTAQVMGFTTSGEKTGCCTARASPQGGDKGAAITITGRNFFPSDDLRCIFRDETGGTAAIVPAKVLDSSYTKLSCPAPTMNPHSSRDCTNPALCQGTVLLVTNDGFTVGPQYMGPKWYTTGNAVGHPDGTPAYLGLNPLKFLFSDIYVSPTGSDTVGDGTLSRPYQTIQRAVDACNEYDQIVLLQGYYTGLGNRGLRHHGKKLNLRAYGADRQNTVIDCQHAPDGFILNNNKDSDSPFAGYIDTKDIITKNCENLRIYDI